MSGRHVTKLPSGPSTSALTVVSATAPTTAVLAALGLAGAGVLAHDTTIAASGAVVAGAGLAVERWQHRTARRRRRLEREQAGDDLRTLREALTAVRADLDDTSRSLQAMRSRVVLLAGQVARQPIYAEQTAGAVPAQARAAARPVVSSLPEPSTPFLGLPEPSTRPLTLPEPSTASLGLPEPSTRPLTLPEPSTLSLDLPETAAPVIVPGVFAMPGQRPPLPVSGAITVASSGDEAQASAS